MRKKTCGNCDHWERDGSPQDGICRYGAPEPRILPKGSEYVVVWARTLSADSCAKHRGEEK